MARRIIVLCLFACLIQASWAQTPTRQPAGATAAPPARQVNTLRLLNQRIPEVTFENVPFEQVMDWVKEITGANVVVRWQALESYGINRDKEITIQVRNLRLSQVLWMIMNEAAGSDVKLAYRASGSLLILSTEEDLAKEVVTKVYDVSDLLAFAPRFTNAARLDPGQSLGQGAQGGMGSGSNLFQTNENNEERGDRAQEGAGIQELINLITETVERDTWTQNGGTGQIIAYGNLLVVSNTLLVHQRLGGYVTENEAAGP